MIKTYFLNLLFVMIFHTLMIILLKVQRCYSCKDWLAKGRTSVIGALMKVLNISDRLTAIVLD